MKTFFTKNLQVTNPYFWILFLLLGIQFIPSLGAFDVVSCRWYILSVFNILFLLFIVSEYRKEKKSGKKGIRVHALFYVYFLFVVFVFLSIFQAGNKIEALNVANHYLVAFVTFFIFYALLSSSLKLFDAIVYAMHLFLIGNLTYFAIQYIGMNAIVDGMKGVSLVKGGFGNKNIFVVVMVLKIPFLLYSITFFTKGWKILSSVMLFLAGIAIFLLLARTAFLSFIFSIGLYVLFLLVNRNYFGGWKRSISISLLFVSLAGASLATSQMFFIFVPEESKERADFKSVADKMEDVGVQANTMQKRLVYWNNTLKVAKEHFPNGCGIGNVKIEGLKYENATIFSSRISKHTHNDFIQLYAEIGLFGIIFLLLLFVIPVVMWLRIQLKCSNIRIIAIAWLAIIGLMIFAFDAFFNFPFERTTVHIHFAFYLALITVAYQRVFRKRKTAYTYGIALSVVLLLLSIPAFTLSFLNYKSSRLQLRTYYDVNGKFRVPSSVALHGFPRIPNLTEVGTPISLIKASYLAHDKKYDEAIDLLKKDSSSSPYIVNREVKLSDIYLMKQDTLMAIYYAKAAVEMRPLYWQNVRKLATLYAVSDQYGQCDKVVEDFRRVKRPTEPRDSILYIDWANIYIRNVTDTARGVEILRDYLQICQSDTVSKVLRKVSENQNRE